MPVGTTATLTVAVGEPVPATVIPGSAAVVRGQTAAVFVVERGVAHKRRVRVLGEIEGTFYLETKLPAGAAVVVQGRETLQDGDAVTARAAPAAAPETQP